jgi:hypothetical protein
MALWTARFIARRKLIRWVNWWAMLSPTSWAESSGRLISSTLIACFFAGQLGQLVAQLVHLGAPLADHHARPAGVHRDGDLARPPLDVDLGDGRVAQPLLQVLPDQLVLLEQRRHVLVGIPAGGPLLDDAEPEPDRMRLLTHLLGLLALHVDLHVAGALADRGGPALGRGGEPLERLAAVDDGLG